MSKANSLMEKFAANIGSAVTMRPGGVPAANDTQAVDKFAGAVRSRAFGELPVDMVDRDEAQPRVEFDEAELSRLAESIRRYGQLAPIRVRRDEARGRWVVLVGERRLRACRLAGVERVRVEFVERPMTEVDVLAEQIVENACRADLQPVEQSRAYKRLQDLNGWTAQQLAETLNVEPTAVYRALALLRLPDDVAELVDSGEIRPTAAYEIAKLQIAGDQRAVAQKVMAEGLDHKATVEEVGRRREARAKGRGATKGKPQKPKSRSFRLDGYKATVECRKGIDPAGLLAMLEGFAEQVRGEMAADLRDPSARVSDAA